MTTRAAPSVTGYPASPPPAPAVSPRRPSGPRQMTKSLTVPGEGPNRPQASRWIPAPDVPVYPVFSGATLWRGPVRSYPSVTDVGPAVDVPMARYAIALAFADLDLREGDRVLIPAYHCDAMVAPLEGFSAQPVFYRIKEDLSIDLEDLEAKIDARTRVIVAVHYFGFHQKIEAIREICDRRGIILLEDCAHAFFGELGGRPIGSFGDYTIASYWKFFPVAEGGVLTSATRSLKGIVQRIQDTSSNFNTLRHLLGQSGYYGRLRALRPLQAALDFAGRARRRNAGAETETPAAPVEPAQISLSCDFDTSAIGNDMLRLSRSIVRRVARRSADIADKRKRNYAFLANRLSEVPGCWPVMPELGEGVVPFMFPLFIERLPEIFPNLEDAAIPMQRFGQFLWPGVDKSTCAVSARFSHHMIQLPCHQELRPGELDWVVDGIRSALTR